MIDTLTTWIVVLSLFVIFLGGLVLYMWISGWASGECTHCGGSGHTIVQGTNGNMQVRCPVCNG